MTVEHIDIDSRFINGNKYYRCRYYNDQSDIQGEIYAISLDALRKEADKAGFRLQTQNGYRSLKYSI